MKQVNAIVFALVVARGLALPVPSAKANATKPVVTARKATPAVGKATQMKSAAKAIATKPLVAEKKATPAAAKATQTQSAVKATATKPLVAEKKATPAVARATQTQSAVKATATKPVVAVKKATASALSLKAKVNMHSKAKVAKPLLPIGEGAYQSAKAVEQRTLDADRDCEKGKWNGCLHNDKADIVDGHSYGNLKGAKAPAPPPPPPPAVPSVAPIEVPTPVKSLAAGRLASFSVTSAVILLSALA